MKHDLDLTRKLGDNAHVSPRFRRRQFAALDADNVNEAVGQPSDPEQHAGATAAGDSRKLRGIPALGYGVSGINTDCGDTGRLMAQRPGH